MDSRSFLDNLKVSGLLHEEQLAEVSGRFANSAPQAVLDDLVDVGLLTSFQIKQLHAGQPKGLVLGQYQLLDELGRGGYGCVYKARHKLMDRIVALKVIAPERVEDSRARAWFRREVLAATQLTHPNIALAYDADEIDDVLFFAMEYIDGLNLDALIRQRGPVPIGVACEMLLQTAKALQYAHEKGMVHRDIKPANLLIPRDAIAETARDYALQAMAAVRPVLVKVVDFGLARLQTSSSNNTLVLQSERSFVGTPAYVSPEQARNVHDVDIRSDLYSLGRTFYHALSGRPPFEASQPLQIVVQHLEKEPEPIENRRSEIPAALASIIRRLMAKKADKRFQTPAELLSELGFFYAQDRSSGVQKIIPFPSAPASSGWHARPTAAPAPQVAVAESDYVATRVCSWSGAPKEPIASAEPALPTPAHRVAAAATCVAESQPCQPPPAAPDPAWAEHWIQWSNCVAELAAGRSAGLNEPSYRRLHRQLVDACKGNAAADPKRAAHFQRIAELVQPWLTPATFAATDTETLVSLDRQCRAVTASLGIGGGSYRWLIGVFILFAVAAGIGYLLVQFAATLPAASFAVLIQRHPVAFVAVFVPAVVIVGALMLRWLMSDSHRQQVH